MRWARQARRRGVSALALILGFALVVSCLALAIDIGLLVQRHQQLKTAGEAASLAGGLRLFEGLAVTIEDEPQLAEARQLALGYAAENSFNHFKLQLEANGENDPRGDVVAGHVDPLTLGSPFVPAARRREHGYDAGVLEPVSFGGEHGGGPAKEPEPLNAILVRTRHSQAGGRGPILFFGSLVGVPSHDVYTESIAAVERRIVGYRPVGCSPVPMLPIICLTECWRPEDLHHQRGHGHEQGQGHGPNDEHHDGRHNDEPGNGNGNGGENKLDKFTYDPRTGLVEEGPDGIPEIELVLKKNKGNQGQGNGPPEDPGQGNGNGPPEDPGQGNGNGPPEDPGQGNGNGPPENPGQGNGNGNRKKFKLGQKVDFEVVSFVDPRGDEDASTEVASPAEQVLAGLNQADLFPLSGQVTIDSQLTILSSHSSGGDGQSELDLEELQTAFEHIIGQPRLLLLGSTKGGQHGQAAVVEEFAAGVVVDSLSGDGSITIRIQPLVLNSCTAVPAGERKLNPWIGKVVLVR